MTDRPILSVDDLTLTFGGIMALNKVSLEVRPGEIMAIIGPNVTAQTIGFSLERKSFIMGL